MPHILVVAQHRGHDAVGEVIQTGRGEDDIRPVRFQLVLGPRGFVVFLADPGEDAHGVVVEAEADCVRLRGVSMYWTISSCIIILAPNLR